MALNKGINVRLQPDMRQRLERVAEQAGVKSSVLIRQAIAEYLADIESEGQVRIVLEPRTKHKVAAPKSKKTNIA